MPRRTDSVRIWISAIPLVFLLAGCQPPPTGESDRISYYTATTEKAYDDVIAELKIAISEQNFRITSHSRVGEVIRNRGTKGFPNYDTIQFCNLSHAKTLLELSSDSIRHMPCSVVVYTKNNKVVVRARLLPVDSNNPEINTFARQMNSMLKEIVNFSTET